LLLHNLLLLLAKTFKMAQWRKKWLSQFVYQSEWLQTKANKRHQRSNKSLSITSNRAFRSLLSLLSDASEGHPIYFFFHFIHFSIACCL